MKKTLIWIMVLALLLGLLTGCGSKESSKPETNGNPSEDKAGEQKPQPEKQEEANLLFTANGHKVTTEDFTYFVRYYMDYIQQYVTVEDWTEEFYNGKSYEDYVKNMSQDWFIYAAALAAQANRLNLEIEEELQASVEEQWQTFLSSYGTEEAAREALEEKGCTEELYRYMQETDFIYEKVFSQMYGENGADMTDDECAEISSDKGYLMAKHILLLNTFTDEEGNEQQMDEDQKAETVARMEELLSQLRETEPERLEETFDALIEEYGEDPGMITNPMGYLFQEGDMVTEFFEAARDMEIGTVSDIVETDYGYHILLRLPLDYDCIPVSYGSYAAYGYENITLRCLCADEAFNASLDSWMERVELVTTELYDGLAATTLVSVG